MKKKHGIAFNNLKQWYYVTLVVTYSYGVQHYVNKAIGKAKFLLQTALIEFYHQRAV